VKVLAFTFEFLPFSGGIATYTDSIAGGLAELGCRVRVLAPHYPGFEGEDRERSYETVRMEVAHGRRELWRFLPGWRALRGQLEEFGPDVALLTSDLAHGIGGIACPRRSVPYLPVVHGSEVAKHFPPRTAKQYLQSVWLRKAYSGADAVLCVSEYVRGLMTAGGFSGDRLQVVHNGIDKRLLSTPVSSEDVEGFRRRLGLEGKKVLLTLARLVERKGQAEMVRAMPEVLARHPQVRYLVAGTGENAPALEGLVRGMGLEEHVLLLGEVPDRDKLPLLDLCDLYVLPSRREGQRVEGLGIALLEAAARGKPLLAGSHGGIPEIISDGENGFLVDARRPHELAQAVIRVFDDPKLAGELGSAARRTVEERFLAGRMAEGTLEVIREVLGS
jgi:phosphatidylinositol alpha-1,6-mannosyltransferase